MTGRESIPAGTLNLTECVASTPSGYADIWRYLFDVDLVATVEAWNRPVDEPLLHLLREPRRLGFSVSDGLWLRLVDVVAALEARRYTADGRVVFRIDDPFRPDTSGTYELIAEGGAGRSARTDADPDLSGSVNVLGATYLGGASFRQLAWAGQVVEHSAGALDRRRRDVRLDAGALVRDRLLTSPAADCDRADRPLASARNGSVGSRARHVGGSMSRNAARSRRSTMKMLLPAVALLLVSTVLWAGPAAAHTFTRNDGNDSPGRLDLRSVSVSHTSTAVVHKVRTFEVWTPEERSATTRSSSSRSTRTMAPRGCTSAARSSSTRTGCEGR